MRPVARWVRPSDARAVPRRRDPSRRPFDETALAELLDQQDGLVCRSQLTALGAEKFDVDRLVRQRRLTRCGKGVYVGHTGDLTPRQRHWAAVLACGRRGVAGGSEDRGAALADESALAASLRQGPGRVPDIHVAVTGRRSLQAPDGIRVHHVSDLGGMVLWNASPPRMRPEYASLRVAARAGGDAAAVAVLTDAVGDRVTTPARQRAALEQLPSLPRRAWLARVVDDLALGTCSVLEHEFLVKVERSHGLPRPNRQVRRRRADGSEYRDVEYDDLRFVVELDGKAFHEGSAARDRDMERDLDDHVDGKESGSAGGRWRGAPARRHSSSR